MQIIKADKKRQMVFGWANVALSAAGQPLEDSQGHVIELEELEQAAYDFVLYERKTGEMHEGGVKGTLVESFLVTEDKLAVFGLAPDALQKGWWVGFYLPDPEVFAKVERGEYAMFSIQGHAVPEEV